MKWFLKIISKRKFSKMFVQQVKKTGRKFTRRKDDAIAMLIILIIKRDQFFPVQRIIRSMAAVFSVRMLFAIYIRVDQPPGNKLTFFQTDAKPLLLVLLKNCELFFRKNGI